MGVLSDAVTERPPGGWSIEPVWAIVPGRMGSERLPGKTLARLHGIPSLRHIIERLRSVPALDGVAVATTTEPRDDAIESAAREAGVPCYRGSTEDVMERTLRAAREVGAGSVVTVSGDCPLVDPAIVARVVGAYRARRPDYAANILAGRPYPRGMDVEAFPAQLLARIEGELTAERDREHVTLAFYENPERFELLAVEPEHERQRRPDLRLTLDTEDDLRLISSIYDALYERDSLFGLDAVLELLESRPELAELNRHIQQKVP